LISDIPFWRTTVCAGNLTNAFGSSMSLRSILSPTVGLRTPTTFGWQLNLVLDEFFFSRPRWRWA
jgi:hypothetical protein